MTPEEYRQYDAIGLADLIRTSQVCAAEVLEAAIAVAEQANPVINGICIPLFEQARAQVLNQSVISSPFAGVPFLVKDL
ncbi:MAG: amidase, partial [Gammaproteobacteria bacterium]|nr:amidase [Gammaproteobacteria bacterium]